MKQTLILFMQDEPGVLNRISSLVRRRNFNIESIVAGSCVAQNYYLRKNLLAPFWYCEEARAQGLFPESRLRPEANNCRLMI